MAGRIDHGGRLSMARARWSDAPLPWIDLSTGINPRPYPPGDIDPSAWSRLPDPAAIAALEATMAAAFGVEDAGHVVACAGSEAALRLLPMLRRGRARVGIAGPTYGSHADAWAAHEVIEAMLPALLARLDDLDVLVVVRPNNPDGTLAEETTLADAAARLAARGGWLVLDEAYADAMPGVALAARDWARAAIVLRSFGKTYGLAGVRLGAVVAPPALVAPLRALLGDWPVSGPAIAVATRAYADRDWLRATHARLAADAARLDALIAEAGMMPQGCCPLFRLIEHDRAAALYHHLGARGILARAFADQPRRLRIGLPGAEADWTRLAKALKEFAR